jgi:hypothetical protein
MFKSSFGGSMTNEEVAQAAPAATTDAPQPPQEEEEEEVEEDTGPPRIGDKCQVLWRDGTQKLTAVVIERRPSNYRKRKMKDEIPDVEGLPAEDIDYYVHYTGHDR